MMVKIFVLKNVPTYVNNVLYYAKFFSCRSDLILKVIKV